MKIVNITKIIPAIKYVFEMLLFDSVKLNFVLFKATSGDTYKGFRDGTKNYSKLTNIKDFL